MSPAELTGAPAPAAAAGAGTPRAAGTPAYSGVWRRRVRSELRLVFGRRRNLALLLLLAAVPLLIGIAVKVSQPQDGEGPPFVSQLTGNGVFLAFTALAVCLPVFLPLALAVVSGDAIAGEAGTGTLRYLLTVPVSRARLLAVKSIGVLVFLVAAVFLVTVIGLIAGAALFGVHGVTLLSGQQVSLGDGLLRALGIALYACIDLIGLVAIGLFFSTLTEVAIGAMAATIVVVIASAVLDSVTQLGAVRYGLLTHYWLSFDELLRTSPQIGGLALRALVPLAYALVFMTAAWSRITTSDVTG